MLRAAKREDDPIRNWWGVDLGITLKEVIERNNERYNHGRTS